MKPHATTRAFSMIEMVLVVAIAAVVAAVAVPRLGSGLPGSRLMGLENRLETEFTLVGELARSQGRSHTIQFSVADDEMRVYLGSGAGLGAVIRRIRLSDPPYNASIDSTNITDSQAMIVVDGFGMYSANARVTVAAGGVLRTIDLSGPLAGGIVTKPENGEGGAVTRVLDGLIDGVPVRGGL